MSADLENLSGCGSSGSQQVYVTLCQLPPGKYRAFSTCIEAESWDTIGLAFLYQPESNSADGAVAEERWAAILKPSMRTNDWTKCLDIGLELAHGSLQLQTPISFSCAQFVVRRTAVGLALEQKSPVKRLSLAGLKEDGRTAQRTAERRLEALLQDRASSVLRSKSRLQVPKKTERTKKETQQQRQDFQKNQKRQQNDSPKETVGFFLETDEPVQRSVAMTLSLYQRSAAVCLMYELQQFADEDEITFTKDWQESTNVIFSLVVHNCDVYSDGLRHLLLSMQPLRPQWGTRCRQHRVLVKDYNLCRLYDAVCNMGGYCTMAGVDWIFFLQRLRTEPVDACFSLVSSKQWLTVVKINCHWSNLDADKAIEYAISNIKAVQCDERAVLLKLLDNRVASQLEQAMVAYHRERVTVCEKDLENSNSACSSLSSDDSSESEERSNSNESSESNEPIDIDQRGFGCTLQ